MRPITERAGSQFPQGPELTSSQLLANRESARDAFYKILEAKPWGILATKYIKLFQAQEAQIIKELREELGITTEEFEECKRYILDNWPDFDYYPDLIIEPLPEKYKSIVEFMLSTYCPTVKNLELQAANISEQAHISHFYPTTYFRISKSLIAKYDFLDSKKNIGHQQVLNYVLLHEIQHILHNEIFHISIFFIAVNQPDFLPITINKMLNKENLESLKKRYSIFQETRADLLACLADPKNAQILATLFRNADPEENYPYHDTHPHPFQRRTYALKIAEEIEKAQKDLEKL